MLFASAVGQGSAGNIIGRWWNNWKSANDGLGRLDRCGRDEVERIARDLSITSGELRTLIHKGADAVTLIYRRLAALGLDETVLARETPEIMRDLQKSCAMCGSKDRCRRDFACGAPSSAWRAYCPNDGTLRALSSQAAFASKPGEAVAAADASPVADRARLHALGWGVLLVVCAWLALNPMPQLVKPRPDAAMASNPAAAPACLDSACLSAQQQAALTTVRRVQSGGWLNASRAQAEGMGQATLETRNVNAAEVQACGRAGGAAFYGLMFQNGCTQGVVEAAKQGGYGMCRSMAGGGACLID